MRTRTWTRTIPLASALALPACLGACAAAPIAPPAPAAPTLAPVQYYGRFDARLFLDVGQRCVDTTFGPADEQLALGLEADIRQPGDDVGLEIGLFCSSEDTSENELGIGRVDYKASTRELAVGARWVYGDVWHGLTPYASMGATLVSAKYSADPVNAGSRSGSDWSVGPYVRLGVEYPIDERWSVGLDYRQVLFTEFLKDLDIGGTATDANYSQIAFVVGYSF